MYCLVLVSLHDKRLEDHALVSIEHGEDHVKMDERLRFRRKLLYDYMILSVWNRLAEAVDHEVYSLWRRPYAVSYNQDVFACDNDVSALHDHLRIIWMELIGIYDTAVEDSAGAVDRIHNERLAHADLVCHTADKGLIADGYCCIPCEIEVIKRVKSVILILKIRCQGIDPCREALNKDPCQILRLHHHEILIIGHHVFSLTYPFDKVCPWLELVKHVYKQGADLVNLGHL